MQLSPVLGEAKLVPSPREPPGLSHIPVPARLCPTWGMLRRCSSPDPADTSIGHECVERTVSKKGTAVGWGPSKLCSKTCAGSDLPAARSADSAGHGLGYLKHHSHFHMILRVMRKTSPRAGRALCKPGAARMVFLEPRFPHCGETNCRQQIQAAGGKDMGKVSMLFSGRSGLSARPGTHGLFFRLGLL